MGHEGTPQIHKINKFCSSSLTRADIEKTFYQVKAQEVDQDHLWWSNGDLSKEPEEYCTTVHLFGGGSSPGCSNFALKRAADDSEAAFGVKAAETLKGHCHEQNFKNSTAKKHVYTIGNLLTVVKFS